MKTMRLAAGYFGVLGFVVLALTGCPDKGGGPTLRVRVVDDRNSSFTRVPNVTVVLGDSNGAMISSGATDAKGEIYFSNPPANATVTAAMTCRSVNGSMEKEITTYYDVNVPAVTFGGCNELTPIGTVTVNITNTPGLYSRNEIFIGDDSYFLGGLASQQTFTVYQHELQDDGTLSIVVLGRDADDSFIRYGSILDQPFADGMFVSITVDQSMNHVLCQMTNIPPSVTYVYSFLSGARKSKSVGFMNSFASSEMTTTINVAFIRDFEEDLFYSASAGLDRNSNGSIDAMLSLSLYKNSGSPADQSFDFSEALTVPADLAISTATGTATPTVTWSGTDPNAVRMFVVASYNNSGLVSAFLSASPSRTSIVFPELPESLAEFRPVANMYLLVENYASGIFSGPDDYLSRIDSLYGMNGTWSIPDNTTYKASSAVHSTTWTYAPPNYKNTMPLYGRRR